MLKTLITKLVLSLRSQAIIAGILTVIFQDMLGLSPAATAEIVALITAFVVGDTFRPKAVK